MFLYFLPGEPKPPDRERIAAAGLEYAFDDLAEMVAGTISGNGGPDGQAGVVIVAKRTDGRVGYYPDAQTWRKIPGSDAWIGYVTDDRPKPADLLRSKVIDGHEVELGDGHRWLVPIASQATEENGEYTGNVCALTVGLTRDTDGRWVRGEVAPKYRSLWNLAEPCWDALVRGVEGALRDSLPAQGEAAVAVLSGNYRLSDTEVDLLGLLDDQNVTEILLALVDWPTVTELLKKTADTAAATSSTDAGPPDSTPTMSQP